MANKKNDNKIKKDHPAYAKVQEAEKRMKERAKEISKRVSTKKPSSSA